MDDRIMEIFESDDKYRRCNCCGRKVSEKQRACLVENEKVHELAFGKNGHSMNICLCSKCLIEFSDMLWAYMAE